MSEIKIINSVDAKELLLKGEAILVDVREAGEYKSEYIEGAVNNPLSSFDVDEIGKISQGKIVIIQCLSGKRASQACSKVGDVANAKVLEGGIEAWKKAGFETNKSTSCISMQRQVMIVAGLFVFVGSLLSIYVNSAYIYIPIFVGGGLMFAGITGWCGLVFLLSKMPWNR